VQSTSNRWRSALARRFLVALRRATHRLPVQLETVRRARVMVLAPHFDDESIACGGTLLLHKSAGSEVCVVFVSDSSGALADPVAAAQVRAVRRAEMQQVQAALALDSVVELEFPDGSLVRHERAIAERLAEALKIFRPEQVFCPFPVDAHADHQATALAFAQATELAGWRGEVLAYEVWSTLWPNTAIDIGVVADADEVAFGKVQALAGRAAIASIERSVVDAMAGRTAGIVTAPINKEAIWSTGSTFLGHTEMLQDLTQAPFTDTMFVVRDLCVFFATRHMSLLKAVQSIDADLIEGSIRRALLALRVFGYDNPRLAVAALNPHGGENGHFGMEEIDEIIPGIQRVNAEGATVAGPIPADSVFHIGIQGGFDGIVSLYHDQGHIATKTFDFDQTVSVTVGLPILRTSVDHGTAFDIAGTGKASPATMESAFRAGAKFSQFNDRIKAEYGQLARLGK